ncbi:SCO7613 C-terminal domain-containing membrane protein [Micromonospora matsumotoense]|uniref:SCO7613 C-terminal domain-containing membrane protein n=1 Tax=Micromonospora matsumotoense TaxID=121616 RepID=UPI0033DC35F1
MENTGYPCPRCGAPAELTRGCVGCGLGPYLPAAQVVRLDREIVSLGREVERAREAYQGLGTRLLAAQRQRAELAARIRREIPAPTPVGAVARPVPPAVRPVAPGAFPVAPAARPVVPSARPATPVRPGGVVVSGGSVPPAGFGAPPAAEGTPGRPETSTRTIQWLLFVLGGLLLGTAAVVFTAVAWSAVGVAGRALILAAFTALALAVPLVAKWRGLRGTAETFAAVGLLLVVLDGYAAWSVNLLGTADWPGTRYAALVAGVSAAAATGYALLSRLTVPWFAALLVVQPVLPLAAAESRPGATGWTLVFLGVALIDLAVVAVLRHRSPAPVAPAATAAAAPATTGPTGPVPAGPEQTRPVPAGPNPAAPVPAGAVPPGSAPAVAGPGGGVVVPAGGSGTTTVPADGGPAAGGGPVAGPAGVTAVLAGRVLGWLGFGAASTVAASCALVPLALGRAGGQPLLAGLPLLLVGLVLAGAALVSGVRVFRQLTAGLLVPLLATAALRPVAELRAGFLLLAAGLVTAGLAGAVRLLPQRHRTGPRVGALLVAAGSAQVAVLATGALAVLAVGRSLPAWQGADAGPDLAWGWQLPLVALLTTGAGLLLLPRPARPVTVLLGVVVTAAALPAVTVTPWPATLAVDLVVGAALLPLAVLRCRRTSTVLVGASGAAVLLGHGLLVAAADPVGMLAALGVVLLVGLAVALPARPANAVAGRVAGVALSVALLTVPAGTAVALRAAGSPAWWQLRAGFAAAALLLVPLLVLRHRRPDLDGYAGTALAVALAAVVTPTVVPGGESLALYAALAVGVLVLADRRTTAVTPGRVVGVGLAGLALVAAAAVTLAALVAPYGGPVRPWSGVPTGDGPAGALVVGVALLVLALTAALLGHRHTGRRSGAAVGALPFGAAALPVLLLAGPAPWPVVPAVVLLIGSAALLTAALAGPARTAPVPAATLPAAPVPAAPVPAAPVPAAVPGGPGSGAAPAAGGQPVDHGRGGALLAPVTTPIGLLWTVFGLVGLLATRAGTLAGLALLVMVAAVIGAVGRRPEVRLLGCLTTVAAATCFAFTAPLAAGLPARTAGFPVLVVAVAVLLGAPLLARRGSLTVRALEAAAQAVAVLALLLTVGAIRHAAVICVLWGAAAALRVLYPGQSAGRRWAFGAVAGGSELLGAWLLLISGEVVLLEAYTLPAAGLTLVAGLLALRTRPGLTSWLALGPGLAAGLLPSLVSVLVAPDPQPWRRLLLGGAALGVVLVGAVRRWQAPVVLGGGSLVLLALHELVRGWDLLPRWIYLAVGGLTLITLAATYERRRRDVDRLRAAVGRMG